MERKVELKKVKAEIESMKEELCRLIDIGADFERIYEMSRKLDKLIVSFQRNYARAGIH